jgi:carbon-monoxide dehydrogenase small subunit
MKKEITLKINGEEFTKEVEPRTLLVHFIREDIGMTGTHIGCDTSSCGACTILIDGKSAKSCTILAVQAAGKEITTVEGIATTEGVHPIQEGFKENHGLHCGFCTPGMMLLNYWRKTQIQRKKKFDGVFQGICADAQDTTT